MAKKSIRIAATIGFAVGVYGLVHDVLGARSGGAKQMSAEAVKCLTGYWYPNGTWDIKSAHFTIPVAAGIGVSAVAAKLGANKYMPFRHVAF